MSVGMVAVCTTDVTEGCLADLVGDATFALSCEVDIIWCRLLCSC